MSLSEDLVNPILDNPTEELTPTTRQDVMDEGYPWVASESETVIPWYDVEARLRRSIRRGSLRTMYNTIFPTVSASPLEEVMDHERRWILHYRKWTHFCIAAGIQPLLPPLSNSRLA